MLERWLRERESRIAIVNIQPYMEVVRGSLYVQRMNADLISTAGGIALVMLTALLAAYIPARRAASVDPIVALRQD